MWREYPGGRQVCRRSEALRRGWSAAQRWGVPSRSCATALAPTPLHASAVRSSSASSSCAPTWPARRRPHLSGSRRAVGDPGRILLAAQGQTGLFIPDPRRGHGRSCASLRLELLCFQLFPPAAGECVKPHRAPDEHEPCTTTTRRHLAHHRVSCGGPPSGPRMTGRVLGSLIAEILVWQVSLSALWLVLISRLEPLEVFAGLGCALLGAVAAVAARRAVSGW